MSANFSPLQTLNVITRLKSHQCNVAAEPRLGHSASIQSKGRGSNQDDLPCQTLYAATITGKTAKIVLESGNL